MFQCKCLYQVSRKVSNSENTNALIYFLKNKSKYGKILYELTMIFIGTCAIIYGLMPEVTYVLTKVCVLT